MIEIRTLQDPTRYLTRRSFLRATGAAVCTVGAARLAFAGTPIAHAAPNRRRYAYVGCYTSVERNGRGEGISVYEIAGNDQWNLLQVLPTVENPSYLIADNAGRTVYSVHGDGNLVSFYRIDAVTGRLSTLGQHDSGGTNGVHIALSPDERFAIVANYASGSIAVFPRDDSGSLSPRAQLLQLAGTPGPVASDQKGPQPHEVSFDALGTHILVPDKGTDRVHRLSYDPQTGAIAVLGDPVLTPAGAGPRHLAYHPTLPMLYLVDELSFELTSYHYDPHTAELSPAQVMPTLPADFTGTSTAAEIAMSADGRFVYVSNRGHDSIAAFGITPSGALVAPAFASSGGQQPRFMTFNPEGRTLYAANQKSDTIVGLTLDPTTGALHRSGLQVHTGTPSSITFVDL